MPLRLRDCPRCGGDLIVQYGEDGCLQCGWESTPDTIISYLPDGPERVGRGRIPLTIEVLGTGIQRRMPEIPDEQSEPILTPFYLTRYWNDHQEEMEREYREVMVSRKKAKTIPDRHQAALKYSDFLERWNLRLERWSKLQRRWRRPVAV